MNRGGGHTVSSVVEIAAEAATRMEQGAARSYPDEMCGLLLGGWRPGGGVSIDRAVETANVAVERRRRFTIAPRVLLDWDRAAAEAGLSIVGFYHSHPDAPARPSDEDARHAWPGYAYVILSTSRPRGSTSGAIVTGIAAWTFDDATTSFRESPLEVRIDGDYVI